MHVPVLILEENECDKNYHKCTNKEVLRKTYILEIQKQRVDSKIITVKVESLFFKEA